MSLSFLKLNVVEAETFDLELDSHTMYAHSGAKSNDMHM